MTDYVEAKCPLLCFTPSLVVPMGFSLCLISVSVLSFCPDGKRRWEVRLVWVGSGNDDW